MRRESTIGQRVHIAAPCMLHQGFRSRVGFQIEEEKKKKQ